MALRVLIYEYVSGGGFADGPTLPPVLSEAYAMLSALLRDFSDNAECEIHTILDRRLAENVEPLAAKSIVKVSASSELDEVFRSALSEVDAVLVVAPETGGTLSRMTETVEGEESILLLGSSSNAVKRVSNKGKAIELASSLGVTVPKTTTTSIDEGEAAIHSLARDIGYPVVVKPNDAAGSEGVFVISDQQDLGRALKSLGAEFPKRRLLIQEYVRGTDASVSVLSSRSGHALPLALNRQLVELRSPEEGNSAYLGGYTPFDHNLKLEAYECARRIAEAVEGLRGYVGIDFVLTEEKPVFMELNARITASYAGLSRVLLTDGREGVALPIMDAAVGDKLPSHVMFKGFAYYSKFKFDPHLRLDNDMIDVLSNLEYVESPPFPLQGGEKEAFLVNVGNSLTEALKNKSRNEKKVERIAAKLEKA